MLRVISQTFLGLILLAAGCYLFFIFLQGLADGTGSWAIFCAMPILISGVLLLMRAGKSEATVIKKTKIPQLGENQTPGEGLEKQLKKNNEIVKEWNNVNTTKEKLRMAEIADSPSDTGS